MKKLLAGISCLAAFMLFGQNLIKNGDFNGLKSLDGFAMTNGGNAVLFTEEYTWNKCAKLAIAKIVNFINTVQKIFLVVTLNRFMVLVKMHIIFTIRGFLQLVTMSKRLSILSQKRV